MNDLAHRPLLAGVPDGRLASFPMVPPAAYIYLSLMLGTLPVALALAVSAAMLGRARLVLWGVGLGFVGFFAPVVPLVVVGMSEEPNYKLAFFGMRLFSLVLGYLMYRLVGPHVRGHEALGGKLLSLRVLIFPAFALVLLAPWSLSIWWELPILRLLQ